MEESMQTVKKRERSGTGILKKVMNCYYSSPLRMNYECNNWSHYVSMYLWVLTLYNNFWTIAHDVVDYFGALMATTVKLIEVGDVIFLILW